MYKKDEAQDASEQECLDLLKAVAPKTQSASTAKVAATPAAAKQGTGGPQGLTTDHHLDK